jgi:hypothetical protein
MNRNIAGVTPKIAARLAGFGVTPGLPVAEFAV